MLAEEPPPPPVDRSIDRTRFCRIGPSTFESIRETGGIRSDERLPTSLPRVIVTVCCQ